MQSGIFECTGIMGQDLVHPYIQSTVNSRYSDPYSENPFIVNTIHIPCTSPIAAVHFHSGYSEFRYSEKSVIVNAVNGPSIHHCVHLP